MGNTEKTERQLARAARWGKRDVKWSPYAYISPFYIAFAVVGMFPLLFMAYIATRKWNIVSGNGGLAVCGLTCGSSGNTPSWLGNFAWALHQQAFWVALRNTFGIFLFSSVPQIILALFIAYMLSANLRAKTFWRMGVLFPYVIAPIFAAIIFSQIFNDQMGLINTALHVIGIQPIGWHSVPVPSWIAIACIVNFRWVGYNALIFLAAMQAVPNDLYEAAEVDGASRMRQLFQVTIPQLRPTLVFVIITSTIGGLQIFDEPQMFSPSSSYGGTNRQFLTITQFLWDQGFNHNTNAGSLGRAAAVAWMLFLIIVALAAINFFVTSRISSADDRRARKQKALHRDELLETPVIKMAPATVKGDES